MSQSSHTEEQPAPDYSNGNRAGKPSMSPNPRELARFRGCSTFELLQLPYCAICLSPVTIMRKLSSGQVRGFLITFRT